MFIKFPGINSDRKVFSASRTDTCGQMDRQTDMKLIEASRNYTKAPKVFNFMKALREGSNWKTYTQITGQ
jgi:hypothetical protein